jgi:hypothetical protein
MTQINVNGDSTAYGAASGSETFVLNGYQNTVLLAGADDTVLLAGGGNDVVDLNSTGFTWATTDSVDLGQGTYDSIVSSHALQAATLSIANGYGASTVSLVNQNGSTSLALGNQGDVVNKAGLGLNDIVTLNGNAANSVSFMNGNGAEVFIGAAGDGLSGYASSVALFGAFNTLTGGDEAFTVSDQSGGNIVALGSGANSLSLGGDENSVSVGNGNNSISLSGAYDRVMAGSGDNRLTSSTGHLVAQFAPGGAGSTDVLTLSGGGNAISGGNENFVIGSSKAQANVRLGNGDNTVQVGTGSIMLGLSAANQATNAVSVGRGDAHITLNGGTDQVNLLDQKIGHDNVVLNGTKLGTALTAHGSFDSITLTGDANAAITETALNGGLGLTIDGDANGGIGTISIDGLAQDDLAHINLVNLGEYTVTVDNTPQSGLTLHFAQGSIDLIGLQSISNHLITG